MFIQGYIVSRTEVKTKQTLQSEPYLHTNHTKLNMTVGNLKPGAKYTFTVLNTAKGARPSEPLTVHISKCWIASYMCIFLQSMI